MRPKVSVEPSFIAEAKRLPPDRQRAVAATLVKFQEAMTLPSLNFRQLKGRPGHFIIDAKRGDRIILRQDGPETFSAVDVGPHENVYRRWDRLKG